MKVLAYFRSIGVCTTAELLALKREHPADYDTLMLWTREQMTANDVEILESDK